ncbi:hypothetical protein BsWGS_10885 [Bradybaena similaris]
MANPILLWFVGYSNITSIAIVTLCFVAMTIFIGFVSMNADYQGRSNVHIGIEEMNMVKMSNPFFLELDQPSQKLTDGLHLRLSSLLPSKVFVLWGAKIHPFHDLILHPGRRLQRTFFYNNLEDYRDLDVLHCDKMQFSEAGDHSIKLKCPDCVSSETLGDMPRKRYPVTVFTFIPEVPSTIQNATSQGTGNVSNEDNHLETDTGNENNKTNYIIGLISVIHLQDEKVSQRSHIISQYVKTSGVPLYSLQPLYLNTDVTQNQQLDDTRENVHNQNHSQHQAATAGQSAVDSEASEHSNGQDKLSSEEGSALSELGSKGNTDKVCCSCGSRPSTEGESLLRKRDAVRSKTEDGLTNVCDKCYKHCQTVNDDKCDTKACEKRGITYEEKEIMASKRQDDKGEPEFQTSSLSECVVCQTRRVRCALLPCRHACVCLGCFRLLYRCPMCRAGIASYFLLRNNLDDDDDVVDEDDGSEEEMIQGMQHDAVNASVYQTFQRWNDKLNHFLGFR